MNIAITVLHILVSLGLIGAIALQNSEGGMGSAFGGSGVYHTKRGIERLLLFSTIFLAMAFAFTSLANVILG